MTEGEKTLVESAIVGWSRAREGRAGGLKETDAGDAVGVAMRGGLLWPGQGRLTNGKLGLELAGRRLLENNTSVTADQR